MTLLESLSRGRVSHTMAAIEETTAVETEVPVYMFVDWPCIRAGTTAAAPKAARRGMPAGRAFARGLP
jgi:hypothetical protein